MLKSGKTTLDFKKPISYHLFRLGMGFALLIAGVLEVAEVTTEEFIGLTIRSHHIIVLFAINQIIIAFAHIIDGLEQVEVVEEEEKLEKSEEMLEKKIDELNK